jgi:hypothetical protein
MLPIIHGDRRLEPRCRDLVVIIGSILENLAEMNEQVSDSRRSKFHSACVPTLLITDYLDRIRYYSKCAPETLVLTLVYVDRLLSATGLLFSYLTAHRSVMAAFLLAVKFNDDYFYDNAFYALVGGMPTTELNELESSFLSAVDFRLQVSPETFESYYEEMVAHGERVDRRLPVLVRGTSKHGVYEEAVVKVEEVKTVVVVETREKVEKREKAVTKERGFLPDLIATRSEPADLWKRVEQQTATALPSL